MSYYLTKKYAKQGAHSMAKFYSVGPSAVMINNKQPTYLNREIRIFFADDLRRIRSLR